MTELSEARERDMANSEKILLLETNLVSTKDLLSIRSEERNRAEKALLEEMQERKKLEDTLHKGETVISMVSFGTYVE